MPNSSAARFCLLIVMGSVSGFSAASDDQMIRAEVQRKAVIPDQSDDPEVAAFAIKFDLRLTNRSTEFIQIPQFNPGAGDKTRVVVLGVETKQANGRWKPIVQSSWYDDGTIKYDSCLALSSGGTADLRNLSSEVLLLKRQLADFGERSVVRLNLMALCRLPDGNIWTQTVTTESFVVGPHAAL
jgi:hypothetical protein